tara:strand:- start:1355 stop:2071 length:717 start_codon:yes stop_codon:yes gene_type:complete
MLRRWDIEMRGKALGETSMAMKTANLSEQIADHLGERIVRGALQPGARLPETELAAELEVSTNSLREAFRVLERRHLVEILPRRGARVCDISEEQVRELYDFLFLLLGELAERAASTWQPGELDDLVTVLPILERAHEAGDVRAGHQAVFEFLPLALRFARNHYMAESIRDLLPQLQRYSFIALTEETTEFDVSLGIFRRLLVNILGRDVEASSSDIREYGENQCRIVLRAVAKRKAA